MITVSLLLLLEREKLSKDEMSVWNDGSLLNLMPGVYHAFATI